MNTLTQRIKFRKLAPIMQRVFLALAGNRVRHDSSNFFFILGSGRNGSTLLSAILNNHPQLFIPPEQYILPFMSLRWQIWRRENSNSFYRAACNLLLKSEKTSNWILSNKDYDVIENAISTTDDVVSIFHKIFEGYSKKAGKLETRLVGDKSPMTTQMIPVLFPSFAHSRYIFLVRDPLDVVASYQKVEGHFAQDIEKAMWKWEDSIRMYRYIKERTNRVLLVRYEDLVTKPSGEISKVLNFLELPPVDEMLDFSSHSQTLGVSSLEHHKNLSNPINPSSIGRGRRILSEKQISKISRRLRKLASQFDYSI